ncbi:MULTISPECIES: N-acetylmuramoyl-L-alanine amidase [Clostridia]|uniref:N-acetylmuramoyl-L-alanine amidase n=1 Tax=Clostridia TaxID=186801 RepID=UPI001313F1F2|nr:MULTISPECIES: N-acetylmuramoyl-L-alanine amidase [Clostridia]
MKNVHLTLTSLAIMLISLFLLPHSSYAANGDVYDVGQAVLNVRSGPSLDSEIVGQLQVGDQLIEFNEQYGWVQTYFAGKEAWVAKHHLVPATQNKPVQVQVKKSSYEETKTPPAQPHPNTQANHNGSLYGYNIMLDPGHGGYDPGSIGISGIQEKFLTLETSKQIAENLRSAGANVLLTRSSDEYVSLHDRVEMSQAYSTHAFISVHYNAHPSSAAHGINTFYYSTSDQKLAESVHQSLTSSIPIRDRGMAPNNYYVLRNNTAPSILLELGFITNYSDFANIRSNPFQHQVASGITNGLKAYFSN